MSSPDPAVVPDGLSLVRTTPTFDQDSVPAGLLGDHKVADGVWGRLVVGSGEMGFIFQDDGVRHDLSSGDTMAIPPGRLHRVLVEGPVTFTVEFYR